MENEELVYRALYDFNLTQLSIIAALEDMAALIKEMGQLAPQTSESLRRHLETVGNNCDRSCNAVYALANLNYAP